jgi:phenylacetate-CoA ligase
VVFSTAEMLYDHQKELISGMLGGIPVVNGYGSREGGFVSHECQAGSMHLTDENLIVEFLQGDQPAPAGQDAEIVLTHLDNHAMPFIRYRTGDIGSWLAGPCPCGRGLRRMNILKGRTTDFIILPDGQPLHSMALIYLIRDMPGVRQFQIVQQELEAVQVKVVIDEGFPPDGRERIIRSFNARLGQGMRVSVVPVDAIPPQPSGKLSPVVSHVAKQRHSLAWQLSQGPGQAPSGPGKTDGEQADKG